MFLNSVKLWVILVLVLELFCFLQCCSGCLGKLVDKLDRHEADIFFRNAERTVGHSLCASPHVLSLGIGKRSQLNFFFIFLISACLTGRSITQSITLLQRKSKALLAGMTQNPVGLISERCVHAFNINSAVRGGAHLLQCISDVLQCTELNLHSQIG